MYLHKKINVQPEIIHKIIFIFAIFLMGAYFALGYLHGERILYNDGLGYDGSYYAFLAQSSLKQMVNKTINPYFEQRILPSILVHYGAKFLHQDISTNTKIIHAFYIYNSFLLIGSATLLWRIGKKLLWSPQVRCLSLALLLFNFPMLKNFIYNPTLTDTTAFFLGVATLYSYLFRHTLLLIGVTFLAAFTYPSMIYAAIPLFIFPVAKHGNVFSVGSSKINITALLMALAVICLVSYLYVVEPIKLRPDVNQINQKYILISLFCLFSYVYLANHYLIHVRKMLSLFKSSFSIKGLLAFALLFVVIKYIIIKCSNNEPAVLGMGEYLSLIVLSSLVNPLTSLLSHIMAYGPVVILLLLFWPRICQEAYHYGLGVVLFLALYIMLGIGPESRQFINALPVFVFLLACVLNKKSISWCFCYSIAGLGVIFSRCWLSVNVGPLNDRLLEFPMQMFFMNAGPWMSSLMYKVFLMFIFISVLAICFLIKSEREK